MKATETRLKALAIIRDNPNMGFVAFAQAMWPDRKMHTKYSHDGVPGKAAWLCAGSYIGRLRKAGLVTRVGREFRVSKEGMKLLEDNGL